MKKFSFSLDRVLTWRRLQREQERAQLEKLGFERNALTDREQATRAERLACERGFATALQFDGYQVATLAMWQSKMKATLVSLANDKVLADARVTEQKNRLFLAERGVRLLERLRERRLSTWKTELSREEEAFAAEAHLARCSRLKRDGSAGA